MICRRQPLGVSFHEIGYMARSSNDSWGQFAGRIMLGRGACGVTESGRPVIQLGRSYEEAPRTPYPAKIAEYH